MSEGNGRLAWILWMAGILATVLTTAVFALAQGVVNNDQLSRERDEKLNGCMQKTILDQKDVNTQILVSLQEIQTDIKYIKREKCLQTKGGQL